jgi:hypothetical protein
MFTGYLMISCFELLKPFFALYGFNEFYHQSEEMHEIPDVRTSGYVYECHTSEHERVVTETQHFCHQFHLSAKQIWWKVVKPCAAN